MIAGCLKEGMKADVNVIDYERLRLHIPEVRYDLPMNGRRLVQRVDGYKHTFVSGVSDVRGRCSIPAPRAGRLVRAPHARMGHLSCPVRLAR